MKGDKFARVRGALGSLVLGLFFLPGLPGMPGLPFLHPSPTPAQKSQGSGAPAAAAPAAVDLSQLTVLRNEVLMGLDKVSAQSPAPAGQVITIGIGLQGQDPAGEAAYVHDEYDSSSSLYHRYLTPAEFNARFGVPAGRYQATQDWLEADGLQVASISGSTSYLEASGTVAQVESLLNVQIDDFTFQGSTYYANVNSPAVPSGLGIAGVTGLNDFEGPRLLRKPASRSAAPQPAVPDPGMNTGTITPQAMWKVYDEPDSNRGDGQQIAIFGWGSTTTTLWDLRVEEYLFKLPTVPFEVHYFGPSGEQLVGCAACEGEWNIDTQSSTTTAPDVEGLQLYFGKQGSDADMIAADTAWASDPNGPLQASSSFGGCEQTPVTGQLPPDPTGQVYPYLLNPAENLYDKAYEQAAIEGRTMFASAGDTGDGCPAIALLALNGLTIEPTAVVVAYPADSTWVVAVGGTVLYWDETDTKGEVSSASRAFEYGWDFTGGGQSLFEPAFDSQANSGVTPVRCVTDPYGNPYSSTPPPVCRAIPDVAAQSGDVVNSYAIVTAGSLGGGGGTSLSSPLWAGMWARINAGSTHPGGAGFAEDALYKAPSGDFFDVGGANTETAPTCAGVFCSKPGWDYLTGLGVPDVAKLMQDVDGRTTAAHPGGFAAAPGSIFRPGGANGGQCAGPQILDPAGDAPDGYPGGSGENLDYYDITRVGAAKSADGVAITTTVKNLTDPAAPPAQIGGQWDVYFTFRQDSDYVEADDNAGQWAFTFWQNATPYAITGSEVYGADGSITMDLPFATLTKSEPAVKPAEALSYIHAATTGTLAVQGNGLHYTALADVAPDLGYGADFPLAGSSACGALNAASTSNTGSTASNGSGSGNAAGAQTSVLGVATGSSVGPSTHGPAGVPAQTGLNITLAMVGLLFLFIGALLVTGGETWRRRLQRLKAKAARS